MVGVDKLKEHEFETIQDYYQYILQSIIVGQYKQARTLSSKLSKDQKLEAIGHYELMMELFEGGTVEHYKEAIKLVTESF